MDLSDENKEFLKSGTFDELGDAMRAEIVKGYLRGGYAGGDKQHDIEVSGITYKVLDRGEVTAFYDALGNALFSVENEKLAAEYAEMTSDDNAGSSGKAENDGGTPEGEKPDPTEPDEKSDGGESPADEVPATTEKPEEDFKEKACGKLCGELEKADDKQFSDPVIGYLLKRCGGDNGLAQDVMQEHKTWEKCLQYIFDQARKQAKGNRAAVRDDVVYEWAEDYYHKDDKAEEEKKAREAAERKKKEVERKKKAAEKKPLASQEAGTCAKKEKATDKPAEPKPKKNSKDMDGQMDMFSIMGM